MTSRAFRRAVIFAAFPFMGVAGAATPASAQIAVEAVRTRDGLTLE